MPQLDLKRLHGHDHLVLHAFFDDLSAAGAFVKDYALNKNKSVYRKYAYGNMKTWVCTANECGWFVTFTKKRASKSALDSSKSKRVSKLAHVPVGAWYISKLDLIHSQCCTSSPDLDGRQLQELAGFIATIVSGHSTALTRVVNSVKEIEVINIQDKPAVVYRAIRKAKAQFTISPEVEYSHLPGFLTAFAEINLGSRVGLQLDSKGRFYRLFLSIGSVVAIQDSMLPVWEVDGTHMKHPEYNGVCLTLLGKDGDKRTIPVAIAYVHKVTIDNFAWFFTNCFVAGIHLDDCGTFTDRGKQLGAQQLMAQWGLKLHLKFCSLHLRFNTMDKFKSLSLSESKVNTDIFRLQSSHSTISFDDSIKRMKASYPQPITKVVGDRAVQEYVSSYLNEIHPTSWTVIGNMQPSSDERTWLKASWSGVEAFGKAMPLFGVRTTSGVEGENNGLLWGGVRSQRVFKSLQAFCLRAVAVCTKRLALAAKWKADGFEFTPHAMNLMRQEQKSVGKLTVMPAATPNFLVFDAFDTSGLDGNTKLYEVNMASGQCSRCVVSEQLQIPCRHIQAVIYRLASENKAQPLLYQPLQYFHGAYTLNVLHTAMSTVSIRIPIDSSVEICQTIKPPPYYRQAGTSVKRKIQKADHARGCKRKRNKGESRAKTLSSGKRHPPTALTDLGDFDEGLAIHSGVVEGKDHGGKDDNEDVEPEIAAFFDAHVSAAKVKVRRQYRCKQCGGTGHNTKTCTNATQEREEAGVPIEPGKYLVGDCPFTICGIVNGYKKTVNS